MFYIDYGTVAQLENDKLCYLYANFCMLDAQAIEVHLGGICPPASSDSVWGEEATSVLRMAAEGVLGTVYIRSWQMVTYNENKPKGTFNQVINHTSNFCNR